MEGKRIAWGRGRDCRVMAEFGRPLPSHPYENASKADSWADGEIKKQELLISWVSCFS